MARSRLHIPGAVMVSSRPALAGTHHKGLSLSLRVLPHGLALHGNGKCSIQRVNSVPHPPLRPQPFLDTPESRLFTKRECATLFQREGRKGGLIHDNAEQPNQSRASDYSSENLTRPRLASVVKEHTAIRWTGVCQRRGTVHVPSPFRSRRKTTRNEATPNDRT